VEQKTAAVSPSQTQQVDFRRRYPRPRRLARRSYERLNAHIERVVREILEAQAESSVNSTAVRLERSNNQHTQNQQDTSTPVPSKEPAVPQDNDLLTVEQAAPLVGMRPKTLYRKYRDLPHVLLPTPTGKKPRIRFRRGELQRWVQSHSFN